MIERAAISLLAVALFIGAYLLMKRLQLSLVKKSAAGAATTPGLPGILYFWSPTCGVCRSTQKPIVDKVAATVGPARVHLVSVNVVEQPELATKYRVLTVPTTVVVNSAGEVECINNGVVALSTLLAQVENAGSDVRRGTSS